MTRSVKQGIDQARAFAKYMVDGSRAALPNDQIGEVLPFEEVDGVPMRARFGIFRFNKRDMTAVRLSYSFDTYFYDEEGFIEDLHYVGLETIDNDNLEEVVYGFLRRMFDERSQLRFDKWTGRFTLLPKRPSLQKLFGVTMACIVCIEDTQNRTSCCRRRCCIACLSKQASVGNMLCIACNEPCVFA